MENNTFALSRRVERVFFYFVVFVTTAFGGVLKSMLTLASVNRN